MSEIFVNGVGVVSPAGWGINSFRGALEKAEPISTKDFPRSGLQQPLKVRPVPPASPRPGFLSHARLRRTSPITQFAVAAGLEAIGEDFARVEKSELRLGIILCVMTGCVNYSRRFYDETLRDPATASPLVFPETVFNAPSSHIASLLGTNAINYTLVGDPGTFLQGIALAAEWLGEKIVDGCLVIGAEELDWLTVEAFQMFHRKIISSEGAGAVYLSGEKNFTALAKLNCVTDSFLFSEMLGRDTAAKKMREQIKNSTDKSLLCDGLQSVPRFDFAEEKAWSDWRGARISPKKILGEGVAAASAWQCVAAIESLANGNFSESIVSVVGCNQQAIGARFNGLDK